MNIPDTILVILLLLGTGLLVLTLTRRLTFLPESMWLIIGGAILALGVEGFEIDTGIRAHNFVSLVFYILLPVLIFEAAYSMPLDHHLRKVLGFILTYATLGLVISAAITGVLIWVMINHSGFPLIVALLTGTLLAATDPVAVVNQLRSLGAPKDLSVLMEGESLFNDATAIVIFSMLLSIIVSSQGSSDITAWSFATRFIWVFFGGAALGIMMGLFARILERILSNANYSFLISVFMAFFCFYLAEHHLHVSGVMAVFFAGVTLNYLHQKNPDEVRDSYTHAFWGGLGSAFNIIVFVLMGLVIHLSMFKERWLAMLIAVPAAMIGRIIAIYACNYLIRIFSSNRLPANCEPVLIWGGLRGIVAIALALSLAHQLDQWFTIQSIAFSVVLFSLLIQAPTNPWLMKRLKIV